MVGLGEGARVENTSGFVVERTVGDDFLVGAAEGAGDFEGTAVGFRVADGTHVGLLDGLADGTTVGLLTVGLI